MVSEPEAVVYDFEGFRLDTRRHVLSGPDGAPLAVAPRALEMLCYFVEHRGTLIDKSTLMQAIWPKRVVAENNLSQHLSTLRRLLRDGQDGRRLIVTVPGRGFRFTADVRVSRADPGAAGEPSELPADRGPRAVPRASVAVLPFVNLSGDPGIEYFGDGLAEELIHMLARVPGLKVPARTSSFAYKGRGSDVRRIARDLGVAAVLEGSVRSAGDRIRITVQMIDAQTGYHLWSQSYDRTFADIFALQEEIAAAIAGVLVASLQGDSQPRTRESGDLEAYRLCLRAQAQMRQLSRAALNRGIELLQRAIGRDPGSGRAHSLLANAYCLLFQVQHVPPYGQECDALAEAERAAGRAVAIDASHPAAHCALGFVAMRRGRWVEAESRFGTVLVSPSEGFDARYHAAQLAMMTGRLSVASAQVERLYEQAPADPGIVLGLAVVSTLLGRDDEASLWLDLAADLGLDDAVPPVAVIRAQAARHAGQYAEALEHTLRVLPPSLAGDAGRSRLARVFAGLEDPDKRPDAVAALQELASSAGAALEAGGPMMMSLITWATLLSAHELAYSLADRFLAEFERSGAFRGFPAAVWTPEMQPFRADTRFRPFVSRLHLPEYWQRFGPPDGHALRGGELVPVELT